MRIWQSIKFIVDTIAQIHLVLTYLFVCCCFFTFSYCGKSLLLFRERIDFIFQQGFQVYFFQRLFQE